jgi:drug/metabolite transporter (DMT)-like permease
MRASRSATVWAALLTVYIIWGSTYLAIRFAVETIPPLLMAGVRFLLAGGVLYGVRRALGDPAPTRGQWKSAGVIGALMLLGGNGLVSWAEQRVVSGVAALLIGATPLWFALLDWLLSRRRPTPLAVLGILIGFGGIVLLINPWQAGGELYVPGAIGIVIGAALWAGGSLYTRTADLPQSPIMGTAIEMLAGGAALVVVGSLLGEWGRLDVGAVSLRSLLGMLYLAAFGSIVAFTAYTWLLRNASVTLVSTYAYVNPVVAVLLGAALAGEPLTPRVLVAAAIIVGSVVLITRVRR